MIETILTILFIILFIKAVAVSIRISWGIARVIACILIALALPILVLGLLVAGGFILLLPIALVLVAFGLAKTV